MTLWPTHQTDADVTPTPTPTLNIIFNDFPGHPAFVELSAALGRAGHRITHVYCSTVDGPRGVMTASANVEIVSLRAGRPFPKHRPLRRVGAEIRYGVASARAMSGRQADMVVANQMPVISLNVLRLLRPRVPVVVWLQDIQSDLVALSSPGRPSILATLLFKAERRALRQARLVMPISLEMSRSPLFAGLDADRVRIHPNWGNPLVIATAGKINAFSVEHDLSDRPTVVYSGTLGIKHDWEFLARLARTLQAQMPEARLVVVSVGRFWEGLRQLAVDENLETLVCLGLQPYSRLPEVLGSADVLLATLKDEAGTSSVPSKVLSYLCASRPIAALVPPSSPICNLVNSESKSGLATSDRQLLESFILACLSNGTDASHWGHSARRFAESHFDVSAVAGELGKVFAELTTRKAK